VIIKKYGISLVRLKKEHIEMVRQKRNLGFIQDKMIYQKNISKCRQRRWFKSINNIHNYYFLIQYEGKFIGLVNGKDADYDNRTMEGGMFLWDKEYWNTHIPVIASIVMNDCSFFISNFKLITAKIVTSNNHALKFNLNIGYEVKEEKNGFVVMHLTKENYLKKIEKIRKGIIILSKDTELLSIKDISFEDDDKKSMKLLYTKLPGDVLNIVVNSKELIGKGDN